MSRGTAVPVDFADIISCYDRGYMEMFSMRKVAILCTEAVPFAFGQLSHLILTEKENDYDRRQKRFY